MKAVFWQGNSERISDRNMQPMFTAMSVVRFLFLSLLYRLLYSLPAYVSIVGSRTDVQNKSRTLTKPVKHPSNLPKWNYDGLSTGQAPGEDSEVILYPQTIFKDSFHGGNNILVICDTYTPQGVYIPTNKHGKAADIFSDPKVVLQVPWFGINQEYTLTDEDMKWPLGWHVGGYPGPEL